MVDFFDDGPPKAPDIKREDLEKILGCFRSKLEEVDIFFQRHIDPKKGAHRDIFELILSKLQLEYSPYFNDENPIYIAAAYVGFNGNLNKISEDRPLRRIIGKPNLKKYEIVLRSRYVFLTKKMKARSKTYYYFDYGWFKKMVLEMNDYWSKQKSIFKESSSWKSLQSDGVSFARPKYFEEFVADLMNWRLSLDLFPYASPPKIVKIFSASDIKNALNRA